MDNEEIIKLLDNMLDILAKNSLVTDEHVKAVEAVEKLMDDEQAAWDMLDELKASEDFGKAFGEFMAEIMGASEVGDA
jgi:hypothetical protein